jgi:hypothetical protein
VVAKNGAASSADSAKAVLTPDTSSMVSAVQGLVMENSTDSRVTLSWKAVAGAEGYQVATRASTPYPHFPSVNTQGNTVTSE